ncbi:MAG: flagellar hook-associated protein 3 [Acidobacteriota bacterium]
MRISENSMIQEFLRNLDEARKRWYELNRQVSSGKKLQKPSDAPADSARLVRIRDEFSRINQYLRNLSRAESKLALADSTLNSVRNLVIQASEKAGFALTGTTSPEGRQAIALELRGILENLESLAATSQDGLYIFSGSRVDTNPLDNSGGTYVYQGDTRVQYIEIAPGEKVQVSVSGGEVFTDPAGDVMNSLRELIEHLEANDVDQARLAYGRLQDGGKVIDGARFKISKGLNQVESAELRLQDRLQNLTREVSELEDADMAEAISRMVQAETALDASLRAGGRMRQGNLFDLIG